MCIVSSFGAWRTESSYRPSKPSFTPPKVDRSPRGKYLVSILPLYGIVISLALIDMAASRRLSVRAASSHAADWKRGLY